MVDSAKKHVGPITQGRRTR